MLKLFFKMRWIWSVFIFNLLSLVMSSQPLEVEFSHDQGFYTSSIDLILNVNHPDATIYYTVDGKTPTVNGLVFNNAIQLSTRENDPNTISLIPTNNIGPGHPYRENWRPPSTTVEKINIIRAIAVLPDGTKGTVSNATYIIDPAGIERYSMPLISLITDPDNLFGDDAGIYVPGISGGNYFNRGREWERDVHLTFFEQDGEVTLSQDAGVRIHGGTSRNRPRKTLRLYARNDYGNTWFDYAIFPDKPVNRYKRFLLRNSGNDWSESIFRDAFMQHLFKDNTVLDIQYSRPSVVFINGEYWGIHNIRDRFDNRYLQTHYGLDRHRISILENNSQLDDGMEDGIAEYQHALSTIRSLDMTQEESFDIVSLLIDVDNFIDYQILQIYSRNTDWPGNNLAFWKYMDGVAEPDSIHPGDGRWRWMAFDLDFGFGLDFDYVFNSGAAFGPNTATHNTLAFALAPDGPQWPNPPWSTELFRLLMQHSIFKERFISRFADHLNTTLSENRVLKDLDSFFNLYQVEIIEHIERWSEPSITHWENEVQVMRSFAELRERFMRIHINNTLNLQGSHPITLTVNNPTRGTIKVNSILLLNQWKGVDDPIFPWQGTYFHDVPVRLIAIPEAGFVFSHWAGDLSSESDTIFVDVHEAMEIIAYFEPDDVFEGDEMNPIAYDISMGQYRFDEWSSDRMEGEFPDHMVFQQSNVDDPLLSTEMTDPYFIPFIDDNDNEYHANDQDKFGFVYSLTGRTRIDGLGEDGIAFINTGRGRDLGACVLALDTRHVEDIKVEWTAQTLEANSRTYNIRLQYRIGLLGEWQDITLENGQLAEYERQIHMEETVFENISLPSEALGQPYIQLRWKYYFTGTRLSEESGRRDRIRLDNILISPVTTSTLEHFEDGNSPYIVYPIPTEDHIFITPSESVRTAVKSITIYDNTGKTLISLPHSDFDILEKHWIVPLHGIPSGSYLLEIQSQNTKTVMRIIKQ